MRPVIHSQIYLLKLRFQFPSAGMSSPSPKNKKCSKYLIFICDTATRLDTRDPSSTVFQKTEALDGELWARGLVSSPHAGPMTLTER